VVHASGYADKLYISPPPLTLGRVKFGMSWHRRNDVHPAQQWVHGIIPSLDFGGDV
jgi:hypothetical protein